MPGLQVISTPSYVNIACNVQRENVILIVKQKLKVQGKQQSTHLDYLVSQWKLSSRPVTAYLLIYFIYDTRSSYEAQYSLNLDL